MSAQTLFIQPGLTDQTVDVGPILDSTDGTVLTGLVYNTASLTCYYRKGATGTATALTLATQTVGGAHTDGGFVEIDATNFDGMYRLDLSDTIIDTAGRATIMLQGAANMQPHTIHIVMTNLNANVLEIASNTAPATSLGISARAIVDGVVSTGSTTTSVVTDITGHGDDTFNGRVMLFYDSGDANYGEAVSISDYVSSTGTFTVSALTGAPSNTDVVVIV